MEVTAVTLSWAVDSIQHFHNIELPVLGTVNPKNGLLCTTNDSQGKT